MNGLVQLPNGPVHIPDPEPSAVGVDRGLSGCMPVHIEWTASGSRETGCEGISVNSSEFVVHVPLEQDTVVREWIGNIADRKRAYTHPVASMWLEMRRIWRLDDGFWDLRVVDAAENP
jgi:hypothetical protein